MSPLSWAAVLLEIAAALALAPAGLFALRSSGPPRATPALELRTALRHPVVAAFTLRNLLLFLMSLPAA